MMFPVAFSRESKFGIAPLERRKSNDTLRVGERNPFFEDESAREANLSGQPPARIGC